VLQEEISATLDSIVIANSWRSTAVCIYRNWLQLIAAQKNLRVGESNLPAFAQPADNALPVLASVSAAP
jgi:hypothetical protein